MKKIVKRVEIGEQLSSYIEMLSYEMGGLKVLNCQIIQSGGADNELYRDLVDRYLDATKKFRLALGEVIKEFAPEYTKPGYEAEVNFCEDALYVYEVGGYEEI